MNADPQTLASRLSPELVALLVVADVAPEARAQSPLAEHDGDPGPVRARWLRVAPGDGQRAPTWLLTVVPDRVPLGRLLLVTDDNRPLTSEPVERCLCEPAALGHRCRTLAADDVRERIQAFLARAPRDHQIALDPELAASLAAISRELRDPPGPADGLALDTVTALDPHAFLLSGRATAGPLTAVSPEGARAPLAPEAIAWRSDRDPDGSARFLAFVALDCPSRHPVGWAVEVSGDDHTARAVDARRPVETDTEPVEARLLELLAGRGADDPILTGVVLATKQRLRSLDRPPKIARVTDLGGVPTEPDVSVIVDVRQFDRVQLLLSEWADDLDPGTVELILVVSTADDQLDRAARLYALHESPLRLVQLTHPARRARAFNLGASIARGPRLLFSSDELTPLHPGWLQELAATVGDRTRVGAAAPKLVDADGVIVSAGHDYVAGEPPGSWRRRSPLAGASRAAAAALEPRRIVAAADACLLVGANAFHACDGFTDLYLDGGDEAGDLCLRLARAGFDTWYAPGAELVVSETAAPTAPEVGLFNDWLFCRRWNATLGVDAPSSSSSSGRPPARRVESLTMSAATADADWIADARLLIPDPPAAMSPFDDTYAVPVHGWARASDDAPVAVEARADGQLLARAAADRTDDALVARSPAAAGACFELVLGSLALPTEFEVELDAVRADGSRCRLGAVAGRRAPLCTPYSPQLAPVLVTTIGRSGSNWLLALLNAHPEIVVYRPFEYEGAMLNYWIEVVHALSAPDSYVQAVDPQYGEERWWLGDGRQLPLPLAKDGADMVRWLGGPNVERIAGFAQSRIDDFYSELARSEGKPTARRFAEKARPTPAARTVAELYPGSREIILVRDFRDRVCSILDYNAKRGFQMWGYAGIADERWFEVLRGQASRLLRRWRESSQQALLVRYEDLISAPEQTLARLLSHAGLEGSPNVVRELLVVARRTSPAGQQYHRTAPSFQASVGRWKRDLSVAQRQACARAFDDLLTEFGYEPTTAAL